MTTPSNVSSRWLGVPPYVPPGESVMNYGAAGDGLSDDTQYILQAMAALTSNGVPTAGARSIKCPLVFPPGVYKVSSDLLWQSTNYPTIMGYGATLVATGTGFTNAVINLDGAYRGLIAGLTVIGDGTEQVTSAVKIDDSTAGFRTTTGCKIQDMDIRNLKYVNGIDLIGTGNRQLDGCQIDNCLVSGGQNSSNWSSSGNFQKGVALGNGTFANNYNHVLRATSCAGHYHNYDCNASSFTLDGGQPANGFVDFNIVPGAQCSVINVQSQNFNEFFHVQGFSPLPVSFQDINLKSNFVNASGYVGEIIGGPVALRNFSFAATQVSGSGVYGNTLIHITNDGSSQRYTTLFAENVVGAQVKTSAIAPTVATGAANIVVANYMNYNPSTGLYTLAAGDVLSTWNSGASTWNNIV